MNPIWEQRIGIAGIQEEAITFEVEGQRIRGILLIPESPHSSKIGIIFFHGFGGLRNGPHDLFRDLARKAGKYGVASLRFDFRGRGESDGNPALTTLAMMAQDALVAVHYFKKRIPNQKLIFVGICSGGNLAISLLDRVPDVVGLFLLSVFPFGEDDDFGQRMKSGIYLWKQYFRKLGEREVWKRLCSGDIQIGKILRILLKPWISPRKVITEPSSSHQSTRGNLISPVNHLRDFKGHLWFIYGDEDPDFPRSHEYFKQHLPSSQEGRYRFVMIKGANHNFYQKKWTQQIESLLISFLEAVSTV